MIPARKDHRFVYQDGQRVIVDVPRAKRAGAREVEVHWDPVEGIVVEVRKTRKAPRN